MPTPSRAIASTRSRLGTSTATMAETPWSMVPGKLQRQCHLGRVMEIQSLGLLGQEKQIRVKYSSKYLPQHILKKMLETPALQARNLTEHPGGRGILAGAGTACLGGQRDRGRNTGRRKGRENLRVSVFCVLEEAGSLTCSQAAPMR